MTDPCPVADDPRFKDRLPRVFVGICAFGDIPHEAFKQFMVWWGATCGRLAGKVELSFGLSPRKEQYRARNALVKAAEMYCADFLLMLDDDQLMRDTPDCLQKFMDFGAPIMGGLYWQRGGLYHPVVMHEDALPLEQKGYRFYHPREIPARGEAPVKVDVVGHGCMWVDMAVYNKLQQPHHWPYPEEVVFVPDDTMGLDVHFCRRAREELGEDVYLMPDIRIGHLSHQPEAIDEYSRPPQDEIDASGEAHEYWNTVHSRRLKETSNGQENRSPRSDPRTLPPDRQQQS